jgi:hydrogenase maturation protease
MKKHILVIGIGNTYRSDDAAGILVARAIGELGLPGVRAVEAVGEGAALMEAWKDARIVFVIDAVSSNSPPGMVHRLDAVNTRIPSEFFHYSTHAFSIAEAVELARALGQLPPRMVIYGIEGKEFSAGTSVSPEVRKGIQEVTERLADEIKKEEGPGS